MNTSMQVPWSPLPRRMFSDPPNSKALSLIPSNPCDIGLASVLAAMPMPSSMMRKTSIS
jgi:hypothetical protein